MISLDEQRDEYTGLESVHVPDVHIVVLPGRTRPRTTGSSAMASVNAVDRLERFVASCPDVRRFRFDGMLIKGHDGRKVRGMIVHAIVECGDRTILVNVHDDPCETFWSTALLQGAASQLGFMSEVVTTVALECAPSRLGTLLATVRQHGSELNADEIRRIGEVFGSVAWPTLGNVSSAFGGGTRGWSRALTAIGSGYVRLAPHQSLSTGVNVHPGPMLAMPEGSAGRTAACGGIAA